MAGRSWLGLCLAEMGSQGQQGTWRHSFTLPGPTPPATAQGPSQPGQGGGWGLLCGGLPPSEPTAGPWLLVPETKLGSETVRNVGWCACVYALRVYVVCICGMLCVRCVSDASVV